MKKIILLVAMLAICQTAYSLQSSSKRLALVAPHVARATRPAAARALESHAAALRPSLIRPISTTPVNAAGSSGYQEREQSWQQSGNTRPTGFDSAVYAGALASAATFGYGSWRLYQKNRKLRAALEPLEEFRDPAKNISSVHFSKISAHEQLWRIANSRARDQFVAALDKEAELLKQGYICFYHGQRLGQALVNDVANMLFFRVAGIEQPRDFYFKQFKPHDFISKKYIPERHKEIMQMGSFSRTEVHEDVLSANLFAFGNMKIMGSSTLHYVTMGTNAFASGEDSPLRQLRLPESIVKKVSSKIDAINKQAASLAGRIVLVAVPQAILDATVYPVIKPGNRRSRVCLGSVCLKNMSEIIEVISREPERQNFYELDNFEVGIPLSSAGLLNPYSGIKLFTFDPEPAQAAQLHQEIDEVVDEIIAELKKSGQLEEYKKRFKEFYALLPELAHEGAK